MMENTREFQPNGPSARTRPTDCRGKHSHEFRTCVTGGTVRSEEWDARVPFGGVIPLTRARARTHVAVPRWRRSGFRDTRKRDLQGLTHGERTRRRRGHAPVESVRSALTRSGVAAVPSRADPTSESSSRDTRPEVTGRADCQRERRGERARGRERNRGEREGEKEGKRKAKSGGGREGGGR